MRRLVALAASLIATACSGPFYAIPGGELEGTLVSEPVRDWTFLDEKWVHLETRPEDPYSVELNYFVREGRLFIDAAEDRRWHEHIRADPRVRARFGEKIYPLRAVLAGRPGELEGFDADRYVYRLEWRAPE